MSKTIQRFRSLLAASVLLSSAGTASALPPAEPLPGLTFQANQAFVGDTLLGMDPGEAGALYGFFEDESVHMASTTKSFTLLLAAEAVESGWVDLDDLVVISEKAAGINDNHAGSGQNTHSNEGLVAGIQLKFEDLLYSMIHTSAGDSSIAIAQHVAVSMDPTLANESDAVQEAAFTDRMNARASELGLDDTIFFNAYGGDHVHGNDNTAGVDTSHGSSARNMASWFAEGLTSPLYRDVVSYIGDWIIPSYNSLNIFTTTGSGSYPGYTGGKGGSGGGCGNCNISSARRIGRQLVAAYTQGASGDAATLLDYGFAKLFHPEEKAQSAPWSDGWVQADLACLTHDVAASAVVDGAGQSHVVVWDIDVAGGSIEDANAVEVSQDPVGGLSWGTRDPGTHGGDPLTVVKNFASNEKEVVAISSYKALFDAGDPPGDFAIIETRDPIDQPGAGYAGNDDPAIVTSARIVDVGLGNVAVVEETDQGLWLRLHGINANHDPFLHDAEYIGEGSMARLVHVEAPSGSFVVTAHRRPNGTGELNSYRISQSYTNPSAFFLSLAVDTVSFAPGSEFELAPYGADQPRFVLADRTATGGRRLRSYSLSSVTGQIGFLDSWSNANSSTQLSVTPVSGFGSRDIFALGFRNGVGAPSIQVFEIDSAGEITSRGTQTSDEQIALGSSLRIAPYRAGGVLMVYQDGASQRLESWSLDASLTGNGIAPEMLTREDAGQVGINGFCRAPGNAAEGDFLLSHGDPAVEGLRLQAWRSAPRN